MSGIILSHNAAKRLLKKELGHFFSNPSEYRMAQLGKATMLFMVSYKIRAGPQKWERIVEGAINGRGPEYSQPVPGWRELRDYYYIYYYF